MKQTLTLLSLFVLFFSCSQEQSIPTAKIIQENDLSAFLEQTKTGDFHNIIHTGQSLLKPGFFIPYHKKFFKAFSSEITEKGQIRYELMSFTGPGSVGAINLFLKNETGEIIQFMPVEATF